MEKPKCGGKSLCGMKGIALGFMFDKGVDCWAGTRRDVDKCV